MNGRFVIEYQGDINRVTYLFEEVFSSRKGHNYLIWISLPKRRDIDIKQLKTGINKYLLRKLNGKTYQKDYPIRVAILKEIYSKGLDPIDACSTIEIKGRESESIGELVSTKDKKIIISDGIHPLCIDEVKRLEKKYQNIPNTYFYVEENNDPISLTEYRKAIEILDGVVEKIKGYNLSPLEAAIYAYDYARDRIYVAEDQDEPLTESRDLAKALLGDKIVCVGYARIFKTILTKLGINASLYSIKQAEGGHAIVIARIKDEKYGLDGLYYFDPTQDRKLDETDEHYNCYQSFAKTRIQVLEYGLYQDQTFGPLDYDKYLDIVKRIKSQAPSQYGDHKLYPYIANIAILLEGKSVYETDMFGLGKKYIEETQDMESKLDIFYDLLCQRLDPKVKLAALARVRKIEYCENPEKYPFSASTMSKIAERSGLTFDAYYCNDIPILEMLEEQSEAYERDKMGIDLVRVLRKVKEQKEK